MSEQQRYSLVPSCDGACYIIGSDGSIHRIREIKTCPSGDKRYNVFNFFAPNGKKTPRMVHHLVAECFLGPRPKGLVINHKDGNRFNNAADNLEYVNSKENTQHAHRIGLCKPKTPEHMKKMHEIRRGQRATNRKFTDEQALSIIAAYRSGKSEREVAQEFGCSNSSVNRIVNGKIVYQYLDRAKVL